MASTTSQLTYFSAVNRRHNNLSFPSPSLRPQSWVVTVLEFSSEGIGKTNLNYVSNPQKTHVGRLENSYPSEEREDVNLGTVEQKRTAKIHDFCFGIPFGGIVLSGGLIGFVFSRNPATLTTGVLYGGALLALSTLSLKIWRRGKSSLPYILGQGALAAALLWKNFQTFSLTKKVFPTGFYAFISGAMLCFYSYVLLSGGNPPPKKLKSSPSVAS
ncbi:protein FATTY ACID EXPORT 1, chloroplastic [Morus notabilis]|uniref:protein FATTY ACID EXPORT 1, chloroplastic n=1 Tax=Morus notabilis TaxID=981085 RepID=UPI000CED787C|nr:protein FATTY ACID EXPORT 1, chloroplastic [Morus notabilis]XP_024025425.1 protein FATTY ACID EXPORT 1, chloroplastic [Morus notabilis]XP_024025426.1 protein FATTY ACID EXPORT 1, chloroplastic [Morus notabilis]